MSGANSGSEGFASGWVDVPLDFMWGVGDQEMYPWDADRPANPSEKS